MKIKIWFMERGYTRILLMHTDLKLMKICENLRHQCYPRAIISNKK